VAQNTINFRNKMWLNTQLISIIRCGSIHD